MGVGSVSDAKQPEPLEPGSAVSAILVRGDMDIAATCTVTYIDAQRLLACGHPLLQFGMVDLPMTKADVVATLPSPLNAFKIVNTTEPVGAFVQDRHTGILGEFGKKPDMIPVTLTIHGGAAHKAISLRSSEQCPPEPGGHDGHRFNALHGVNEYGEETTYRMNGRISVKGYPDVTLQNMFAPTDGGQPAAVLAALSLGDRFGRIYDNPYNAPGVRGVKLDFDLVHERRWARLESARTDVTEARPGRRDHDRNPAASLPRRRASCARFRSTFRLRLRKGRCASWSATATRSTACAAARRCSSRKLDLASTIALLNKEHANNRVYVSLLEADPEAMVADKVMPTLPLSIMNVMDGMRGTQEMVVLAESSVNEAATRAAGLRRLRRAGADHHHQIESRGSRCLEPVRAAVREHPRIPRDTLKFPAQDLN